MGKGSSATPNPLILAWGAPLSPRASAVSSPQATCMNAILSLWQKASRCAAKNDIQPEGSGRNATGCDALFSLRADFFHFGWEQRRVGPFICGFASANE